LRATASAHGRVNLIGEHTDYNCGFVLPAPIPQHARATVTPTGGAKVRGNSRELGSFEYELGAEARRGSWSDYVQGVTRALASEGFKLSGFELELESDVPIGAGVSSSAALEIALLKALTEAFSLELPPVRAALIGQRAENELVGARVGIMDQLAAALSGGGGHAIFIDTRDLSYRPVPIRGVELVVIHSGISHRNAAAGGYNTRRSECEQACALLGVSSLREVSTLENALPEPLGRRVRHVVSENRRVLEAVRALEAGDASLLGRLFLDSHRSMREDYQVSIPEIDALVEIAAARPEIHGARMTGGGFGGSIVALAKPGAAAEAAREIAAEFARKTGEKPVIIVGGI
jgi:galactokinase